MVNIKLPFAVTVTILVIFLLAVYLFVFQRQAVAPSDFSKKIQSPSPTTFVFEGDDEILKNALNLYVTKKEQGVDFSNGPCLGKIADDWVLDIAHDPRQPVDDKAQNQCKDFKEGKVNHFIELDPDGKLIRSN